MGVGSRRVVERRLAFGLDHLIVFPSYCWSCILLFPIERRQDRVNEDQDCCELGEPLLLSLLLV